MATRVDGRKRDARFLRDGAVFFSRLVRHPRVPRRHKLLLIALLAYLASPIDLVPDFIPVVGHLDDALLVAAVLRFVVRRTDPELVDELWPPSSAAP
jgi:uncharacterized membrane protein YkvA (DUF1232 family)